MGERLLYEVQFTLNKATHLIKKIENNDDAENNNYSTNLIALKNKFSEVISSYDPQKRAQSLIKKNLGLEDALNEEFSLTGKYNSGEYSLGEIWNKPEGITDEGPAQQSNLGFRTKLRLWKFCVEITLNELEMMEQNLVEQNRKALAGIVKFQIIMLKDNVLQNKVKRGLAAPGSFSNGLKSVLDPIRSKLKNPNPKFDRSADLKDLEQRLLRAANKRSFMQAPHDLDLAGKIILCRTILPTEILQYNKQGANGFIILHNEKTSHAHILLKSMNIDSITSIEIEELDLPNGTPCILDSDKGLAIFRPSNDKFEVYADLINNSNLETDCDNSSIYIDEEQFFVRANISLASEVETIVKSSPDGIGLFRSELEFMLYNTMPDVEQQVEVYKKIVSAFPNNQVVLRVLDSGGDKVSNYNTQIKEENPSLGFKAIRYLLSEPNILNNQIEAMVIAMLENKNGTILIPMISNVNEAEAVYDVYKSVLGKYGDFENLRKQVKLAMMIETPASVIMLDKLHHYFDSFSIGTNDLTQYILAADRNNSHVSSIYSHLSPAVFRTIGQISEQCRKLNKPLSICGELAHSLEAIPILIGFGIRDISINHKEIAHIRNYIRKVESSECFDIAQKALQCANEKEILDLINPYKEKFWQQS